jgi:hypothetical protein
MKNKNTDNIETRLKDIMKKIEVDVKEKYDKEVDVRIRKEQEEVINKLLKMFPQFQPLKNDIMAECIGNKKDNNGINDNGNDEATKLNSAMKLIEKPKDMVFDQIEIDGHMYYLNSNKGLWDINAKLVGSLININDDDTYNVSFFDEDIKESFNSDIPTEIKNLINKL